MGVSGFRRICASVTGPVFKLVLFRGSNLQKRRVMQMNKFDIYLSGVGGQGIGLLSELIARAIDHSGQRVIGADTHGLAQRGGMVSSHIRMGEAVHAALIQRGKADICIVLERHEALRAMNDYLKENGTLIYYDAVWQPLDVRLMKRKQVENDIIESEAKRRGIRCIRVFEEDLEDARMQNACVASKTAELNLIPNVKTEHFKLALEDLMKGPMLEKNLKLFQ
jgi:indolepyruvate ferredoxin oxidoreductase beta subunit